MEGMLEEIKTNVPSSLELKLQKTTDSKATIDWSVMTPVEITNELQVSDHGNSPDRTFEEENIDDGIQTLSNDTDPQDATFEEIPINDENSADDVDEN